MNQEEAIAKSETGWWETATDKEIVDFQLYEPRLCMPFDKFHEALTKVLGRDVWTHELADNASLIAEYEGKREPEYDPLKSSQRILRKLGREDLIDKTIVVNIPKEKKNE